MLVSCDGIRDGRLQRVPASHRPPSDSVIGARVHDRVEAPVLGERRPFLPLLLLHLLLLLVVVARSSNSPGGSAPRTAPCLRPLNYRPLAGCRKSKRGTNDQSDVSDRGSSSFVSLCSLFSGRQGLGWTDVAAPPSVSAVRRPAREHHDFSK